MMIKRTAAIGLALTMATILAPGVLVAQREAQPPQTQSKPQSEQKVPEVFCDGLSTGQLCLSSAPKVLKLDEAQKQRWTEAARQYNKGIDAATKQFLEQSKPILSPEQFASMQKWFEKGLNPVLNQMLMPQPSRK